MEETLQIRDRLLNSITTLLMQNRDKIAITVDSSFKVTALQLVSVEQEVNTDDESEYQESESSKSATKASVLGVTNPRNDSDDNWAFVLLARCVPPLLVG